MLTNGKLPEFLLKLKKLVDSPQTDHLITWSDSGESFLISDGQALARDFFPLLFKHKNVFSFIRQLNMYGFHKINRVEFGITRNNFDDSEWSHPCFIRGRSDLLKNIQRKTSPPNDTVLSLWNNNEDGLNYKLTILKSAVNTLRDRDIEYRSRISDLEQKNTDIKNSLNELRYSVESHKQLLNNIFQYADPQLLAKTLCWDKNSLRQLLPLPASDSKIRTHTDYSESNTKINSPTNPEMVYSIKSRPPNYEQLIEDEQIFSNQFLSEPIPDYDIEELLENPT